MALDQSDLTALATALTPSDGADLVHDAVRLVLQELIEAEATQVIGAARYERTGNWVTERNGHRPRTLSTMAGDIEVGIPKLEEGSFFPQILEPRRRIDQALYAVVMEAYVHGVSMRPVPKKPRIRDVARKDRLRMTPAAKKVLEEAVRPNRRKVQVTAQQVLAQILTLQRPDPAAVLLGALDVHTSEVRRRLNAVTSDS